MRKREATSQQDFSMRPLGARVGAEIGDLNFAKPIGRETIDRLQQALLDKQVLHFPGQHLTPERVLEIGKLFGKPEVHPVWPGTTANPEIIHITKKMGEEDTVGTKPRTISSFFQRPTRVAICYNDASSENFDYVFASLTEAWEGLSEPVQDFLIGLRAIHSGETEFAPEGRGSKRFLGQSSSPLIYSDAIFHPVEHPLVHVHPDSGRKSLFINEAFTQGIVGLEAAESDALLEFLFRHCAKPEYGCRVVASSSTLTIFDNRVTTQRMTDQGLLHRRKLVVIVIAGEEKLIAPSDWPLKRSLPL